MKIKIHLVALLGLLVNCGETYQESSDQKKVPIDISGSWENDFLKGKKLLIVPNYRYHVPEGLEFKWVNQYSPQHKISNRVILEAGYVQMGASIKRDIFNEYRFGNDWKEPDTSIRKFLELNKNHFSIFKEEQILSCIIMDHYLLKEADSPELLSAIEFYTEILLVNKSEEYELMSRAIERLRPLWPKDKIDLTQVNVVSFAQEELLNLAKVDYRERKIRMKYEDIPAAGILRIDRRFDQRMEAVRKFIRSST